jgi:phytoene dehydrogenase-like protein
MRGEVRGHQRCADRHAGFVRVGLGAAINPEFPRFTEHVVASELNTARSLATYLNAPDDAIYGFEPLPPSGPSGEASPYSPKAPVGGLYLESSYAGAGGFTGAITSVRVPPTSPWCAQ